ncbi:MAG TPA: SDR family oxidoreductase [Acidimicrobiales bacterium]|nr:SDR family oxidoreductase [Acidimicrobiales bacterium]
MRPVALVTGASRRQGLGAAIALALAEAGWDVAITYWSAFDSEMEWGADQGGPAQIGEEVRRTGARFFGVECDLTRAETPAEVLGVVEANLGPASGLVLNHCECRPVGLMEMTRELLARHFTVNVQANALLIQEFATRFPRGCPGRIASLTSDHTAGNVPYGVTKGAADRLTLAAAHELAHLGVTANAINPGPTDTGWMDESLREDVARKTPLNRPARPEDVANLVAFLFSEKGSWVTGQLLYSNGGFRSTIG